MFVYEQSLRIESREVMSVSHVSVGHSLAASEDKENQERNKRVRGKGTNAQLTVRFPVLLTQTRAPHRTYRTERLPAPSMSATE